MSVSSQPHLYCEVVTLRRQRVCVSCQLVSENFIEMLRVREFPYLLYYIHLRSKHRIPQDLKVTSLFSWYSAEAVEIC